MARVTGIGGVFLRSADNERLTQWYAKHLGIAVNPWGASFSWTDEVPAGTGATAWSVFAELTTYFSASDGSDAVGGEPAPRQAVMINYRVDDLDTLLEQLGEAGVWIDPHREDYDYGRFAWIKDCDGNRLELWQPMG